MDFWSSMRLLARWWYVVLLGLIVTGAVVAMVFRAVPPTYSAVSQQVFLASPAGPVEPGTAKGQIAANPLLELGSGYNVLAELIAKMMNGAQGQLAVQKAGGDGDYIVDTVSGDAPVVSISVEATSPGAALATERVVRTVMAQTLEAQQKAAGADSRTFVVVRPVFQPLEAVYEPASRVRAGGALFVVGLALTLGSVFFVESIAERRRRGPDRHPGGPRAATLGARDVEVFPQQQSEAGATRG